MAWLLAMAVGMAIAISNGFGSAMAVGTAIAKRMLRRMTMIEMLTMRMMRMIMIMVIDVVLSPASVHPRVPACG
jgi:hypothetical protein